MNNKYSKYGKRDHLFIVYDIMVCSGSVILGIMQSVLLLLLHSRLLNVKSP